MDTVTRLPETHFRSPVASDGAALWRLVADTGVLDLNSAYLYMLLGQHFSSTCLLAEQQGEVVGFVSGYIPTETPDTLFLWQIGVAASARGQGLAKRLLHTLLRQPGCRAVRRLEMTISPSNQASRALFASFARDLGTDLEERPDYFPQSWFPSPEHEAESLFIIAPVNPEKLSANRA